MHKSKSWILLTIFIAIQFVVSVKTANFGLVVWFKNIIIPGVTINDIDVGGLTPDRAVNLLQKGASKTNSESILTLTGPDNKSWSIKYNDINLKPDYNASIAQAVSLGKKNGSLSQLYSQFLRDANLPVIFMFDQFAFRKILMGINAEYERYPPNAYLAPYSKDITVLSHYPRLVLDVEGMVNALSKFNPQQSRLELKFRQVKPEFTFEDFKGVYTRMGFYTTVLDLDNINRTQNIRLSSQLINNSLVRPGELFSFNKILGPRTKERGFLKAPVIINNHMALDYGGGVCQLSSTLYMTVLKAGLRVIKRVPHSIPVYYVPLGYDATIDGDNIDFQFANNKNYPVVITSAVKKDHLIVSIYGQKGK